MAMYPAMRAVSKLFPFTYYTDLIVDQMLRGAPVIYSLPDLGGMALFIVLPLLLPAASGTSLHGSKILGKS